MNGTALYRALVEAGASEERAKEAAESVVYAPEAATRSDVLEVTAKVAEVRTEIAEVRTEVARTRSELLTRVAEVGQRVSALETTMERTFRTMTFRLAGLFLGMQALFFAALRFTGST